MPRKKSVSFSDVTILEFPIILGENPAVSGGAPIELGWELMEYYTRDLQLYEYMRSALRKRGRKNLIIPVSDRAQLLMESGYSIEEIAAAVLRAEETQKQRSETLRQAATTGDRMLSLLGTTGRIPLNIVKGVLKFGAGGTTTSTTSNAGGKQHHKPNQNIARSAWGGTTVLAGLGPVLFL